MLGELTPLYFNTLIQLHLSLVSKHQSPSGTETLVPVAATAIPILILADVLNSNMEQPLLTWLTSLAQDGMCILRDEKSVANLDPATVDHLAQRISRFTPLYPCYPRHSFLTLS